MNTKMQRILRDIERTKTKIAELQALLPELERQKTEAENAEVIKVFRSANVEAADFAEFIATYRARENPGAMASPTVISQAVVHPAAPQPNHMEEPEDE